MPEPMETLSGTIGTNSPDRVVPATGIFNQRTKEEENQSGYRDGYEPRRIKTKDGKWSIYSRSREEELFLLGWELS